MLFFHNFTPMGITQELIMPPVPNFNWSFPDNGSCRLLVVKKKKGKNSLFIW